MFLTTALSPGPPIHARAASLIGKWRRSSGRESKGGHERDINRTSPGTSPARIAGSSRARAWLTVPWGPNGSLDLTLPSSGVLASAAIEEFWPDTSGRLADYAAALEQALDSPVASPPLEHQVSAGTRVAIVVDDPSRWTPVREALPIVLRRLHLAGVAPGDVTISVRGRSPSLLSTPR